MNPCYRPPPVVLKGAAAAAAAAAAPTTASGGAVGASPEFQGDLERRHEAFRPAGHFGACGSASVAHRWA